MHAMEQKSLKLSTITIKPIIKSGIEVSGTAILIAKSTGPDD